MSLAGALGCWHDLGAVSRGQSPHRMLPSDGTSVDCRHGVPLPRSTLRSVTFHPRKAAHCGTDKYGCLLFESWPMIVPPFMMLTMSLHLRAVKGAATAAAPSKRFNTIGTPRVVLSSLFVVLVFPACSTTIAYHLAAVQSGLVESDINHS